MTGPFEVFDYSIENLKILFEKKSKSSIKRIEDKLHTEYFRSYFDYIQAKTILIENNYIDHDYLEDFSGYYVKCFKKYPRKCCRFHFFSHHFSSEDFHKFLSNKEDSELNKEVLSSSYLGFVVVKPLPVTIIGRTCLKTYPTNGTKRYFPITRTYEANLFGLSLPVNTLAYQEQDSVTAACATSALWSVFQGTGKLFQHIIPSPVEITRAATNNLPIESRVLPNKGLNAHQMANAIRHVGLEPLFINIPNISTLKSTIYAYLRGKLPIVLSIGLYNTLAHPNPLIGWHAIAVTGYSVTGNISPSPEKSNFRLTASKMDKIYVHDDQIGPFARMEFDGLSVSITNNMSQVERLDSLSTSWRGEVGAAIGTARAVPSYIIIPLYHKIRIPYWTIHTSVLVFNSIIENFRTKNLIVGLSDYLDWEIYLSNVNEYKNDIISSNELSESSRIEILTTSLPRFLWIARAWNAGSKIMDLLFDATDIELGLFFLQAVGYNENIFAQLKAIPKVIDLDNEIFDWFKIKT
jgi:hypothetical protein